MANNMNIFEYAVRCNRAFEQFALSVGYERQTTFFIDLSLAECFGPSGVRETYDNVMRLWIDDYKFMTEFILCLAWKCDQHYSKNEELANLYSELRWDAEEKFYEHYANDEKAKQYYFEVTD